MLSQGSCVKTRQVWAETVHSHGSIFSPPLDTLMPTGLFLHFTSPLNNPWLQLHVDLSPKFNFHGSLPPSPSLNLTSLPTARHFCFHMANFSGNTLIFVAFGVGSRVCCACQVFLLRLTPAPKLNCLVISCHPHHPPRHSVFANNVKFHR